MGRMRRCEGTGNPSGCGGRISLSKPSVSSAFGALLNSQKTLLRITPPVLTRLGHWLCTAAMVLMPVSAPIKVVV